VKGPLDPETVRARLERAPRMLLIRLRSLGDSILALPLLDALQRWRPGLKLDVLVEQPYAAVFAQHPAVDTLLTLRPSKVRTGPGLSRAAALWMIRRRRYPAVLDLHGGTTAQIFVFGSGAPIRIGQEQHRRAWVYNARVPPSSTIWGRDGLHTVEHQASVMRWLGLSLPPKLSCRINPGDAARTSVGSRLAQSGIRADRYLVIHPTATLRTKQWSAANFAEVADRLVRCYRMPVIITAGPSESQVLLDVGKHASETHFYWSDLTLAELFALIERCRLFVGNDSGPTHAAAALGRPVVAVWGSSNQRAWHPWGTEYELVGSDLPCMPCPGYTCAVYGEPRCITEVPVAGVLGACERVLARTRGAG
jgi:predicted lipopolysaccharide heptosyltransferase III